MAFYKLSSAALRNADRIPSESESRTLPTLRGSGTVSIRELLTNSDALSLAVVGPTSEGVEEVLHALDTLGIDIERMEVMNQKRANPPTTSD